MVALVGTHQCRHSRCFSFPRVLPQLRTSPSFAPNTCAFLSTQHSFTTMTEEQRPAPTYYDSSLLAQDNDGAFQDPSASQSDDSAASHGDDLSKKRKRPMNVTDVFARHPPWILLT